MRAVAAPRSNSRCGVPHGDETKVTYHLGVLAIVQALGHPIISTSVGFSGQEVLSDPLQIEETFGAQIELTIDGGSLVNQPSSIISLLDDQPEVIRVGQGDVSQFL